MEFEVVKIEYINKPQIKDQDTLIQFVNVTVGVVGCPYTQFKAIDTYEIDFPNTGLDALQIEQFVDSKAEILALEKYPNID